MAEDPRVTVLLAAHNRLALLKESLHSALAQEVDNLEVLVVDDGSGPETRLWLEEQAARWPTLRIVRQENQGVASARQNGLLAARGAYICILDSDDQLEPGALARILTEFQRDPSVDLIYTSNTHMLEDGSRRFYPLPIFPSNAEMIRAMFLKPRLPVKHSGTTFRREEAIELGGYDTSLPIKIDIDFFLRYLAAGKKLRLINEPLVVFRMHRDSISAKRLLGIRIYWLLADRYGPTNLLGRLRLKLARTTIELGKLAYRWFWIG